MPRLASTLPLRTREDSEIFHYKIFSVTDGPGLFNAIKSAKQVLSSIIFSLNIFKISINFRHFFFQICITIFYKKKQEPCWIVGTVSSRFINTAKTTLMAKYLMSLSVQIKADIITLKRTLFFFSVTLIDIATHVLQLFFLSKNFYLGSAL